MFIFLLSLTKAIRKWLQTQKSQTVFHECTTLITKYVIALTFSTYFAIIFPTFNQLPKRTKTYYVLPWIPSHSSTELLNIQMFTLVVSSVCEREIFSLMTEVKWAVLVESSSVQHNSSTEESWNRKEITRQKEKEQTCLGK